MAILKIKQPNGPWAIVGDTSETIKFTEQQLTEEQKKVARENIGAAKEDVPIIKNDLNFTYDPETDTWDFDPTLTYIGEGIVQLDCGGYNHFASLSNWTLTGYGSVKAQRIWRSEGIYSICLNVKQTVLDNFNNIEHYRVYTYDATEYHGDVSVNVDGWSKWFSNLPWPLRNVAASDYWKNYDIQFPVLGIDYSQSTSGTGLSQSDTCTIDAKDLINYWTKRYADGALVHYDKSQSLTEAQKTQVRENIGAGRTTLVVNDEEIEIYTPIGTQGSATGAEIFNDYYSNQASGEYSHAEGLSTEASGARSHAEGDTTHATAMASHAEGADTHAEGIASHAEGYGTYATGDYSHAEGYTSEASGDYSHAEGYHTAASDSYAHAEGEETTASGYDSHAEGYDSEASGQASHAEGYCTSAEGDYSHTENYFTTASSDYAHAEGYWTTASGDASHAEGASTVASGTEAHAEGWQTVASGRESHAEGEGTIANSYAQHAQGKYNIEDAEDTYAHIVGNGSSDENRSNAHTLDWEGNAWFAGDVYVGSTSGKNKDEGSKKLIAEDADGNVSITGNLTVKGTTYTQDNETLRIADNIIELNSTKVDNSTTLSGIAINKNENSTYGVMYDPADDTVKFGLGSTNAGVFSFSEGEGAPLAIRDDSSNIADGAIMIFDKSKNRLVDSGYTIDGFKQWVKDYIELYMSTIVEENEAGGETLNINTNNYTDDNGTLIIGG